MVEGDNAFAVALYGQLRNQSGNLFFSPESISTALAMAYAGARGDTASEMAKTLHFTLPPERLHPAMGALLSDLNAAHQGYQLSVANALWAQRGYHFLDDFLQLMNNDYGACFNQVDFKGATEAARLTINQWVEQKTANKITNLLPPGSIKPTTRLVLTNAIYFKGDWQSQFDKAQTKDEDFHLSPAQSKKAPLMHREGGFNYFDGKTFQVLEIPYQSKELSMVIFLPNDVGGLPALENSLTASNATQWLGQLSPVTKVIVTLPKFKTTQQFELGGTLAAMGMPQAFTGARGFFRNDGKEGFRYFGGDPQGLYRRQRGRNRGCSGHRRDHEGHGGSRPEPGAPTGFPRRPSFCLPDSRQPLQQHPVYGPGSRSDELSSGRTGGDSA